MVASLLKVLTTGIQNERLYFKPTLYPFIKVWYKVGRFTTQWQRIDFDSAPQFGQKSFITLPTKGHLITRLYLVATMPDIWIPQLQARTLAEPAPFVGPTFGWTNSLGHALIANLTLDIGGTRVEQIDSNLLEVLDEYLTPMEKVTVTNRLIKRLDNGFTENSFGHSTTPTVVTTPLPFWFARGDPACALPIDAILADEIKVGIEFRPLNSLYYTNSRNLTNTSDAEGTSLWPLLNSPFYRVDPGGIPPPPGLALPQGEFIPAVAQIQNVSMPQNLFLGECYLMAEYIYLDQPEANKFRIGDLQYPITQHYRMKTIHTQGVPRAIMPLDIPNPTRDIYWMVQRIEAPTYNAHFLATRDLSAPNSTELWWPNAEGLNARYPSYLYPAFAFSDSEPLKAYGIVYEGNLVRMRTEAPAAFRSILPSYECKKSPWVNRYYYNFPLGIYNGTTTISRPRGEANLDKIQKRELYLEFAPNRGCTNPNDVPKYIVYAWAETYNVLRVYGGRAGCLFSY